LLIVEPSPIEAAGTCGTCRSSRKLAAVAPAWERRLLQGKHIETGSELQRLHAPASRIALGKEERGGPLTLVIRITR
jgi:hypothetical protein